MDLDEDREMERYIEEQRAEWEYEAQQEDALIREFLEAEGKSSVQIKTKMSRLDDVMCCSGHDCGCRGSSNREYIIYLMGLPPKEPET